MTIVLFIIIYIVSIFLYKMNLLFLASILMLAFSIFAYIYDIKKTNNIVNLRALYSLGFLGSFSLSFLKLSNLSLDYNNAFFVVIFLAIVSFYIIYELSYRHFIYNTNNKRNILRNIDKTKNTKYIYYVLLITMSLSFVSFVIEASILRFIPLFMRNVPHAYSSFHIFMLHYVTTFYVFVPSIAILYYYYEVKNNNSNNIIIARLIVSILYAIFMSILLVSRGQMLMSILMALFMFIILFIDIKDISIKNIYLYIKRYLRYLLLLIIVLFVLYLIITIKRSHSVSYLNDIFDMKNKNIPIFITQPYMYLTQGFENLNYMIEKLVNFTFGKRSLKPLFTLTFMDKFFFYDFIYEQFILKTELTNTTLFYDAYFDFSYFGVIILSSILGYVSARLEKYVNIKNLNNDRNLYQNPMGLLFYVLVGYYLIMSFFQPFFSLTSSVVYILFIVILYIGNTD